MVSLLNWLNFLKGHAWSAEQCVIGLLEQTLVVRFDFQLPTRAQSALSRLMDWSRDGGSWHTLTHWILSASWPKMPRRLAMYSVRFSAPPCLKICALVLESNYSDSGIVNRHDPRDPTNLSPRSRSRIASHLQQPALLSRMTSSLRIGVPIEYNISELSPSVRRAWALSIAFLREQGHTIHPVSLPTTKLALSAYYVLAPAEASSNLAKYDGIRYGSRCNSPDSGGQPESYLYAKTRGDGFGLEVKRRILLGAFSLSADAINNYFIQAQRVRRLVQHDFNAVFRAEQPISPSRQKGDTELKSKQAEVDVLICPTAPSCPPQLADLVETDSIFSSLNAYTNDVFTVPASLAGLPAASVPVRVNCRDEGSSDADLAGIQIIGQYGDDELVLKVSESLEGKIF